MLKKTGVPVGILLIMGTIGLRPAAQDLSRLGRAQDFRSGRVSSFDRTGGNNDRISIQPGETAVLAEIDGPAAIHHLWTTIDAEAFYGRKIILRIYWDDEEHPSVETPIGDFFGVGHGLNRNIRSLPIACSSDGRARNAYWYMPFRQRARITASNQGDRPVGAFYYYVDYRTLPGLPPATPYFHAQYRQETPCRPGENYLLLDADGRGHYVGCVLSILQRAMGWWGEGDDMIFVDGEEFPSLYGTGSEDYFSDAWGMREDGNLFYGCPLQEEDFQAGSKATVYRWHIPDPIPFDRSIRVTIEHGHANDRADYFSSVAFWYQSEPHRPFPDLPLVEERLPFAMDDPGLDLPEWTRNPESVDGQDSFSDTGRGLVFSASRLVHSLTSFYDRSGRRYPVLTTDGARIGTRVKLALEAEIGEYYNLGIFFMRGPDRGGVKVVEMQSPSGKVVPLEGGWDGFSEEPLPGKLQLRDVLLEPGVNRIVLEVTGKTRGSSGSEAALIGIHKEPSRRRFIREWNLIGPFDAPDMSFLLTANPPETGIDMRATFQGKNEARLAWAPYRAPESGYVRLDDSVVPSEQGIVYGAAFIHSPDERDTLMMIGSDDGVRLWVNGFLVHTNPAYRGAYPDQDRVAVRLKKGWNRILIKVLQGAGGWGFYVRFVDPGRDLEFSPDPGE